MKYLQYRKTWDLHVRLHRKLVENSYTELSFLVELISPFGKWEKGFLFLIISNGLHYIDRSHCSFDVCQIKDDWISSIQTDRILYLLDVLPKDHCNDCIIFCWLAATNTIQLYYSKIAVLEGLDCFIYDRASRNLLPFPLFDLSPLSQLGFFAFWCRKSLIMVSGKAWSWKQ